MYTPFPNDPRKLRLGANKLNKAARQAPPGATPGATPGAQPSTSQTFGNTVRQGYNAAKETGARVLNAGVDAGKKLLPRSRGIVGGTARLALRTLPTATAFGAGGYIVGGGVNEVRATAPEREKRLSDAVRTGWQADSTAPVFDALSQNIQEGSSAFGRGAKRNYDQVVDTASRLFFGDGEDIDLRQPKAQPKPKSVTDRVNAGLAAAQEARDAEEAQRQVEVAKEVARLEGLQNMRAVPGNEGVSPTRRTTFTDASGVPRTINPSEQFAAQTSDVAPTLESDPKAPMYEVTGADGVRRFSTTQVPGSKLYVPSNTATVVPDVSSFGQGGVKNSFTPEEAGLRGDPGAGSFIGDDGVRQDRIAVTGYDGKTRYETRRDPEAPMSIRELEQLATGERNTGLTNSERRRNQKAARVELDRRLETEAALGVATAKAQADRLAGLEKAQLESGLRMQEEEFKRGLPPTGKDQAYEDSVRNTIDVSARKNLKDTVTLYAPSVDGKTPNPFAATLEKKLSNSLTPTQLNDTRVATRAADILLLDQMLASQKALQDRPGGSGVMGGLATSLPFVDSPAVKAAPNLDQAYARVQEYLTGLREGKQGSAKYQGTPINLNEEVLAIFVRDLPEAGKALQSLLQDANFPQQNLEQYLGAQARVAYDRGARDLNGDR